MEIKGETWPICGQTKRFSGSIKLPSKKNMISKFDHRILLFQGGGALGAYQAGVYEGLAEAGMTPNWVVGISIGAVNSALIAGNPPERRVERLRAFWDLVSSYAPLSVPAWLEPIRPALNLLSAGTVATFGIQGFFVPRALSPFFAQDGSPDALSFYDIAPLKRTLEELVDFDLINRHEMRLSLGAVNVRTSASVYFDNQRSYIGPDHVLASGALPPGFSPVTIDGESYWDGSVLSNSPLWYVFDTEARLRSAFVLAVDLFNPQGELPRNLDQVLERAMDIQYASKRRYTNDRIREVAELFAALRRVLSKLPPELNDDPDVQKLAPFTRDRDVTLIHLLNQHRSVSSRTKFYEFSRATVNEAWAAGLNDVRHYVAKVGSTPPTAELGLGVCVYEFPSTFPFN
jgi:NTE family protein